MRISRLPLVIGASLMLAACSSGAPDVASPSATAHATAAGITKDQWVAALGPDGVQQIDDLLAEPGAAQWLDATDATGMTALLYAADAGDATAVGDLLDAGADPLWRDRSSPASRGPIHIAAANGDIAVIQVLLDHGVDVDTLDGAGGHALLWAAYKGQLEAARFLLEAGADPTIVDASTMNAAGRAAKAGHPEVAALIQAAIDGS